MNSNLAQNPFLKAPPKQFGPIDNNYEQQHALTGSRSTPGERSHDQETNQSWDHYLQPTTATDASVGSTNYHQPNINPDVFFSQFLEAKTVALTEVVQTTTKLVIIGGITELVFNTHPQPKASSIELGIKSKPNKLNLPVGDIDLSTHAQKVNKVAKKTTGEVKDFFGALKALWFDYVTDITEKREAAKKAKAEREAKKDDGKNKPPTAAFASVPGLSPEKKGILTKQAADINRKIGNANISYTGVFNPDGSVRIDIQALLDKKNSELQERELRAKKEQQVAAAAKVKGKTGVRGPRVSTNLNQSAEDLNNASRLLG